MKHLDQKEWCRAMFANLLDGGLWAVPRSGVLFRKNAKAKALVVVGLIPSEMTLSDDERIAGEFYPTRRMFGKVGISVELGAPIRHYNNIEEAKAHQASLAMVRMRLS